MVMINLVAPMALTRDLAPALIAAPGRVVNVGSVFGDIAYPAFAACSATEFGLRGFSGALRRDMSGQGVSVSFAAPRATITEATSEFDPRVGPMGMTLDVPDIIAHQIRDGVAKGEREVFSHGAERRFVLIQRLFPRLIDRSVGALARDPKVLAALGAMRAFPNPQPGA
ncbi:MAG: short-subunit dehydrogenase [Paracoccaceae bacterium]|jgi:short-subunit dehydrogenase